MASVVDEPVLGRAAGVSRHQAASYLRRQPRRKLSDAEVDEVLVACWEFGERLGIAPDLALAQMCHETDIWRFGGQVQPAQHNPAGIGATNDGAADLTFPNWREGIRA